MSLVLVSKQEKVGVVTLNRPQARNALSGALIDELLQALKSLDADPEIGAIVLTGAGTMFCGECQSSMSHYCSSETTGLVHCYQLAPTSKNLINSPS